MFNLRFILSIKKYAKYCIYLIFFCTFAAGAEYMAKSE